MNEYDKRENLKEISKNQIKFLNQMVNSTLTSGELKLRMKSIGNNLINGCD